MAVWLIIKKAIKIWLALRRLKRAKINAYRISKGLEPIYTWMQLIWFGIKRLFKCIFLYLFCFCCVIKCRGWKHSLWDLLWIPGTFPNEVANSIIGFLFGLICTHLASMFLIFSLNFDPTVALTLTFIFGTIFTFSLAFTKSARCFTLLSLPPLLFSKEGRVALLAYILVLALSGPGKNTAHNMEVLTESLVCSEEMANQATGGLIDLIKNPTSFMSKAVAIVVERVHEIKDRILAQLGGLEKVIASVVEVVLDAYNWLKAILDICNSETGSAYGRCWAAFQTGMDDCLYQLPEGLQWACGVVELGQNILCPIAKVPEVLICWFPAFVKQELYLPIKNYLEAFMQTLKTFFKVGIHFHHHFHHDFNSTKSIQEIVRDIKEEVMSEVRWLLVYVDWVDMLVSIFFIYGFIKAFIYRYRYQHSDRYDNAYITEGLVRLDWERKLRGREFIFPLKYHESKLYVDNFSFQLLEHEERVLRYSLIIVFVSCAKILSYLFLDLLLFLFLELLRKHGAIRIETQEQLTFSAKIVGNGFLADMYRGILLALTPVGGSLPAFDTTPCLPIAREPDYWRYALILFLMFLAILTTYVEPWGLRVRHIICGWYYPERDLPRERWLYFHILNSRGNFFSFAKSQLLSRSTKNKLAHRVGFLERLSHTIPCFYYFLKWMGWEKKSCFICGREGDKDDYENFYHCPSCGSVFCLECYQELEELCPLCSATMRLDSIDEETGSDPDDDTKEKTRAPRKRTMKRKGSGKSNVKYDQLRSSSPSSSESSPRSPPSTKQTRNGYTLVAESESEPEETETETEELADESDATETVESTSQPRSSPERNQPYVEKATPLKSVEQRQRWTETASPSDTAMTEDESEEAREQEQLEETETETETIIKTEIQENYSTVVTSSESAQETPRHKHKNAPESKPASPKIRSRRSVRDESPTPSSPPSMDSRIISQTSEIESEPDIQPPRPSSITKARTEQPFVTSIQSLVPNNTRQLKRKVVRVEQRETPSSSTIFEEPTSSAINIRRSPVASTSASSSEVTDTDNQTSGIDAEPAARNKLSTQKLRSPKAYYKLYYHKGSNEESEDENDESDDLPARICVHNRAVDEETYLKYLEVVTELESQQGHPEGALHSSSSSTRRSSVSPHDSSASSSQIRDDVEAGICYHHQSVDEDTASKYSDVVSELESMQSEVEASSTSTWTTPSPTPMESETEESEEDA